jgi:hypothetical protein
MAKICRRAGRIDLSVCDLAKLFFDFGSDFHALQAERTIPIVKNDTNRQKNSDKCGKVTGREIQREGKSKHTFLPLTPVTFSSTRPSG